MREHTIHIDADRCVGCGLCQKDCPANNMALAAGKAAIKSQHCILCGHCVAICPQAAVTIAGLEAPIELDGAGPLEPQRLLDALRARRSIRQFQERPVDSAVIRQVIEAGRLTPTAKNAQDVSYLVLGAGRRRLEALAVRFFRKLLPWARLVYSPARGMDIDDDFFFKGAPVAIVVAADAAIDGGLAAANMALMAEAHGLGVLYSGFFTIAANHSPALRRALGLRGKKAVTTLVLGHPAVRYRRTAPKRAADVKAR